MSLVLSLISSSENEVKLLLTLITPVSKHVFMLMKFEYQVAPTQAVKWVISKFLSTVCLPPAHKMPCQTERQQAADVFQRAFLVIIINEPKKDLFNLNLALSSDNSICWAVTDTLSLLVLTWTYLIQTSHPYQMIMSLCLLSVRCC